MKKGMIVLMEGMMICYATACYAGEYLDETTAKLKRGVINVVSCVGEVGKGMTEGIDEADNAAYGSVYGTFLGAGKTIVRAASGLYDIVVAPIPNIKTFPPEPEILFEEKAEETIEETIEETTVQP